jgi:7,8-dihydropterin-6-yl-methyl-4-(beta-D-ribofuranosyl)aminobenzene 5'-phosphate synthase
METATRARVTVVVDNHIDMLLTDTENVHRFGIMQHFVPPNGVPICTENGVVFWIQIDHDDHHYHLLFDTGLTGHVLLHNFRALGLSSDQLNRVIISHGHPDHFSGLIPLLHSRTQPLSVVIHPDAFLPKFFVNADGERTMRINRGLERLAIEEAGGMITESPGPTELAPGCLVTGEIERGVAFEPPVPASGIVEGAGGVFTEKDGKLVSDDAPTDDQAVIVNVAGAGLVVLTACGHSGIVNTIRYAQKLTGVERVYAIMGGFHTGLPGVPEENGEKTVEALKEFDATIVAPMHCTGLRTIALALSAMPDRFLHNVVGTTVVVG